MRTTNDVIRDFERNRSAIRRQCEGLTDEDSLVQPPFSANCLNWTVGHIVVHRDRVLDLLGGERVLDPATFDRYDRESDPVTGPGPDVRSLDELLLALDTSQERIAAALPGADFEAPLTYRERTTTVGARVHFLYFHDTYHTGQTELLRALAGKNDTVI